MGRLVEAGLAQKDQWGNWRLKPAKSVKKKHRCTLLLSDRMSERDIKDQLVLKMAEMGWRQVRYKVDMPLRKRIKEERRMMLDPRTRTMLLEDDPLMGRSKRDVVKLVKQGWAPMNTKTLCRVTMLGKHELLGWKKRAKRKGWIKQKDHSEEVLPTLYGLIPDDLRSIEAHYRGAVSFSPSKNKFLFHQASCYKLLTTYGKN